MLTNRRVSIWILTSSYTWLYEQVEYAIEAIKVGSLFTVVDL